MTELKQKIQQFSRSLATKNCPFWDEEVTLPKLVPRCHICMEIFADEWSIKPLCETPKRNNMDIEDVSPEPKRQRIRGRTRKERECIVNPANYNSSASDPKVIIIHHCSFRFGVCRISHFSSENCITDIQKYIEETDVSGVSRNKNGKCMCQKDSCFNEAADWIITCRDMDKNLHSAWVFCSITCFFGYIRLTNSRDWAKFVPELRENSGKNVE